MTKNNILLVEDDLLDIKNIQRAFSKNEIDGNLHIAKNGIEALEMLRGTSKIIPTPKIVLLDINMPKMNGLEFLKEIRNDSKLNLLTVIVLTTSDDESDKLEAYNLHVSGYMLKPNSSYEFVEKIKVINSFLNIIELPLI